MLDDGAGDRDRHGNHHCQLRICADTQRAIGTDFLESDCHRMVRRSVQPVPPSFLPPTVPTNVAENGRGVGFRKQKSQLDDDAPPVRAHGRREAAEEGGQNASDEEHKCASGNAAESAVSHGPVGNVSNHREPATLVYRAGKLIRTGSEQSGEQSGEQGACATFVVLL